MPDRLPSLIVLVGFWIPPALAGWIAAGHLARSSKTQRNKLTYATLAVMMAGYAAAWFLFNLHRMPPYIRGAALDPRVATPEATRWLAVVAAALVLPGSILASVLAFRWRSRLAT